MGLLQNVALAWSVAALAILIGLALEYRFRRATRELNAAYKQMQDLALRDGLTRLLNRRSLEERALIGMSASKRKKLAFAVAMVDIDHFKRVNDGLGHAAGDQVLTQLAKRLTSCVRASDDVGRWGGEEFLVLFPESNRDNAAQAAERLRTVVAAEPFIVEGTVSVNVTVSVGVAMTADPHPSPLILDALIRQADEALYAAKDGGRNQVVVSA